jgi:hypothetical protein
MKGHINKIAKKKADDHWHILCLKIDLEQHNGSSSRSKQVPAPNQDWCAKCTENVTTWYKIKPKAFAMEQSEN